MKKRILVFGLAAVMIIVALTSCGPMGRVDSETTSTNIITNDKVTGLVTDVTIDETTEAETESSTEHTIDPDPFPDAVKFSDLPTTKSDVLYSDFKKECLSGENVIKALVTFVQFKDGYVPDKTLFESRFNGEYDFDNCIRSVSSFYRYSSFGKIKFEFTFLYYESDMTCEEAWHYVNDEYKEGYFYGNQFLFDIFNEMKSENKAGIDYRNLDGNGDGFVDLAYFIVGEDSSKTDPGGLQREIYGSATSWVPEADIHADLNSPSLNMFIKSSYENMLTEPEDTSVFYGGGARTIIHETGHTLGLYDYYDTCSSNEDTWVYTLGMFDMMDYERGDHNPFSKFALGWINVFVVQDIADEITIRMSCSDDHSDVVLIPTSKGWNGTAFDEYILVDVCAPIGAVGFDWKTKVNQGNKNRNGGVRMFHVDARLVRYEYNYEKSEMEYFFLDDPRDAVNNNGIRVTHAFINTRENVLSISGVTQSEFYHLVEIIPSGKNANYRKGLGSTVVKFSTDDLFGKGNKLVLDRKNKSFANAPYMNNGGTIDYSVIVEYYDANSHEAIITIKRIIG